MEKCFGDGFRPMTDEDIAEMRVELADLRAFKKVVTDNFMLLITPRLLVPNDAHDNCFSHGDNANMDCKITSDNISQR